MRATASSARGLTVWVAPNRRANSSLAGETSTATSAAGRRPASACRHHSPIGPHPSTTPTSPASGAAARNTVTMHYYGFSRQYTL
jgi:hypothetical protein